MSENNQDIGVFLNKTSKEAINDFLKYYLENSDVILNASEDDCNANNFKIYWYDSYIRDHNSSTVKPQLSFLFPRYYLTIMVDLTSSMFTTTNDGDVKIEKGLEALKEFLYMAVKSYTFNNGLISYTPEVIVNVICFNNTKINVIIKGWELRINKTNFQDFCSLIFKGIYNDMTLERGRTSGGGTFFGILREGIISLNLLEEDNKSLKHLLIVSDGQYPISDGVCLDRCLSLLRHCNICCSFIHVKTTAKNPNITDQSHDDQLHFVANVTGGFYKTTKTVVETADRYILRYRFYDQSDEFDGDSAAIRNFNERNFNIPPSNILFSVIKMGFFLQSINNLRESRVEIGLVLPWRNDVFFKIALVTKLPLDLQRKCFFSLSIFGQNYFLHSICKIVTFDSAIIDQNLLRFFRGQLIKEIRHSLKNIEIFSQFSLKPMFTVPNFINNGLKPMLSPTNQPCDRIDKQSSSFFEFWRKTLDLGYLHCFQTTKIHILLEHDYPFPEFLSGPDPINDKYNAIQGRESLVQLSVLLNKNFCTFIVKENNTYVKLFFDSLSAAAATNSAPSHFCVLKMNCDGLEVKLLLHFFVPTPEKVRDEFVSLLVNKISVLKFQPRGKQARPRHMSSQVTKKLQHVPPQQRSWEQINCCTVLDLDLSNLLATYNPIRKVDGLNQVIRLYSQTLSSLYLYNHCHHDFRIWTINEMFLKNIFEILIKIRLQEGFHIATSDSTSGFINLIKEIVLINNESNTYKCFIQYLIYPDHNKNRQRKDSDDSIDPYGQDGVRKIYTEILIEKKYGKVINSEPEVIHWDGLCCDQIAETIIGLDLRSIETFVTFECFKIYPMTLGAGLVKPNICSVLNKSPHCLIQCPLFVSDNNESFILINKVFLNLLDNNLKQNGFNHIDITKTESTNFNKLAQFSDPLCWNCYYMIRDEFLVVVMVPETYLEFNFKPLSPSSLPILVYGLSLKHLSFLIEDSWTLKIPDSQKISFPLDEFYQLTSLTLEQKTSLDHDKENDFAIEMDKIVKLLCQSVQKLNYIYLLTFVGSVHRNLLENNPMDYRDLTNTFDNYCSELMGYVVDATKFINTICSHCYSASKISDVLQLSSLGMINKDNCELRPNMHRRIIIRIRQMMAKYFKEVPQFPQILIYCPDNEGEQSINEYSEMEKLEELSTDNMVFGRQKSQDNQYNASLDMDYMLADSVSEVKSVSSIRLGAQSNCCPLFISIKYTLIYDKVKKYLEFDSIPTCISDFYNDIKTITDDDINFSKLKFNLDMIPITYLDEGLNDLLNKTKNEDHSVTGEVNSGSKLYPTEIAKRYLTSVQTQLLDRCKLELLWTLEDEVVNCLKYCNVVDATTIDTVKQHIINTSTIKLQKNFPHEIQKKSFDLEFVFGSEKSNALFHQRFEKITLGKHSQYRIDKIDGLYCVFQKRKICSDPSAFLYAMFPDQNFAEMEDISIQSRMRVDSLCITSLQTASDNLKGDYLRRCSSEGKLSDLKSVRKMCESKRESVTLFERIDNQINTDQTKTETSHEFRPIANAICVTNQYPMTNYSMRQYRSPMPSNYQQSSSQTPKRHRSGEASSIMCTGNYRCDTPMQLNDLVSTATSSKGYEGDSSRVSDGEEYDRFSNCPTDINNKISITIQDDVAPFWLLLEIIESCKQIDVYFHHTDTCTMSSLNVCEHCANIDDIFDKINGCVHEVNQCLLLEQLAQTRICRDILVSENVLDSKNSHFNQLYDDYDDDSAEYLRKFAPGTFACPLILKIIFKLHPRTSEKNSKVISALRMSLENLVILNRRNMLIFIDDNTNGIFYSLLNEVTKELNAFEIEQLNDNSVLITDPNNMEPDAINLELTEIESFQQKNSETSDNLSIRSAPAFNDVRTSSKYFPILKSKTMELLELSVHGVDKLSDVTIKSIVANIGSKLDHIVLRSLSDLISRCTTISLNKEDLDFLLSIDYNNKPQKPKSFFWSLPPLVVDNCLAFCYYLKQNLQSTFIAPKIADMGLYKRFNFSAGSVGEAYLYNQSSAQGVASDAIVLLTVQLLSAESFSSWTIKDYSLPGFQEDCDLLLSSIIRDNRLVEINVPDAVSDSECCLKFSLWLRGHVAIDVIKKKIVNLIQYSLTDLVVEFVVIPRSISTIDSQLLFKIRANKCEVDSLMTAFETGENGVLQKIYAEDLFNWFPELSKADNPLIKHRKTDMFSDFNVEFLINDLVDGIHESINFNVFMLQNDSWIPWSKKYQTSGKEFPGMKRSFILIGRMEELWKKFVSKRFAADKDNIDLNLSISQTSQISTTSTSSTCTRKFRMLLKQLPYENNSLNSSLNSSTTTIHNANIHSQNLPEFCHVQVQSAVVIPRQMLCIVKIDGCQIDTISYNLAKETIDNLNNLIDSIVKNDKSRFQMLNSFIYQKLGLFHESLSTSCLQSMNVNTIKTLSQIGRVKNSNLNFGDITRDRRPSGSPRSFSPSSRVSNTPSSLTGQNKSNNKAQATKKAQLNINICRIYQDPYTIFSLSDVRKLEAVNDIIYQHATQFLNTYAMAMKRHLSNIKVRHCITLFQPKAQSENPDTLSQLEQLEVFSSMKRSCRVFHSVVCPILFIPSVRKSLLNITIKNASLDTDKEFDKSSPVEEWMNNMSIKLLGYYAEYVQKEHGFQFVNPPRPNVSQNPCSHALFQKSVNNSGIYLMEVFILKGCLCVRLSAFEYRRFSGWILGLKTLFNNFPQPISQPQKTFVEDACKLCDLTHLFSFVYDFYVGMVVKSITYPEEKKKYFNVVSFLRDFVQMYSYPPMYACNHIYWMPYSVCSDLIKPNDLFEFLVRHYEDYGFTLSHNISDQSIIDTSQLFIYNINDDPFPTQNWLDIQKSTSPSSSPLDIRRSPHYIEERPIDSKLEHDFTSIFCLTTSTNKKDSSFDLFIVTFNRSNSFPHQRLIPIKKMELKENVYFPAKYLSILPHKSSSPDNMLHLTYCPISINSIDTNQLPHSLAWKTFDNRSVVPLQVPLFLTLRNRIETFVVKSDLKLKRAITDCHKDSLWHRMYQKPDINDSTKLALQFTEFQDLINSGDIVDLLELDPRLVDSMKIATSYLTELNRCMCLLSEDCSTLLYENASPIYKSPDDNLSTHLVLMSKNTNDGFLLLSKTQSVNSEDNRVELKAVFRSQDCRSRIPPQIRYFSSSLRDVTVMLAETAAFCIWRKLAGKLSSHVTM